MIAILHFHGITVNPNIFTAINIRDVPFGFPDHLI
jgi:hypothetical protein